MCPEPTSSTSPNLQAFEETLLAQNIPMQWDKKEEEEADWLWVKNLAVLWRLGIAALFAKAPWDCTEQTLLICLRGWTKKAQKRWERYLV
jgi:hypothetical protein